MDFYESVRARRTVRDFESAEIPREAVSRIIEAGLNAPTNDHMRDWHYIVVQNRHTAAELLNCIPSGITDDAIEHLIADWNLTESMQQALYRAAVPKQRQMLADASVLIIPLLKQKTDILRPENVSHLNGFASIWCSVENILLAAAAEGYGCCLRVPLGTESVCARNVLRFPAEFFMPCFIGIGVPKKDAPRPRQKQIDIEERIHWNAW